METATAQVPAKLAPEGSDREGTQSLRGRIAHVLLRFVEVSETFIPDAIFELDQLGWQGTVITTQLVNREIFAYPPDARVRLAARPSLKRRLTNRLLLRNLPQRQAYWLEPELAALAPDLVHVHFGHCATAAAPACARLGLPLIVSLHGTDVTAVPQEDRWAPGGYGVVFRHAACVVVPSKFLAGKLVELGYRGQIEIVPAGIRLDRLPFRASAARRPGDPVRLLIVARQVPVKGTDVLLRALPRVMAWHSDVSLDVIGPLEADARANIRLADELGLRDAVTFHGAQSHERTLASIRAADIVVVPSRRAPNGDEESSSLVTREALASGVPVVATASGGIAESVPPGYRDELVPPDDPSALAAQISRLLAEPDNWPERAVAGREWIKSQFDSRQLARRIGSLYRQILASRHE